MKSDYMQNLALFMSCGGDQTFMVAIFSHLHHELLVEIIKKQKVAEGNLARSSSNHSCKDV